MSTGWMLFFHPFPSTPRRPDSPRTRVFHFLMWIVSLDLMPFHRLAVNKRDVYLQTSEEWKEVLQHRMPEPQTLAVLPVRIGKGFASPRVCHDAVNIINSLMRRRRLGLWSSVFLITAGPLVV